MPCPHGTLLENKGQLQVMVGGFLIRPLKFDAAEAGRRLDTVLIDMPGPSPMRKVNSGATMRQPCMAREPFCCYRPICTPSFVES